MGASRAPRVAGRSHAGRRAGPRRSRGAPAPTSLGRALPLLVPLVAGCASLPPSPLRPQPVPWADTLPIAEPPSREPTEVPQLIDAAVTDEVGHALGLRRLVGAEREALNVTRFDDVVPSAWYEPRNRLDAPLEPAAVARGPTTLDGPSAEGPLTVVAAKTQGISPGFTIRDARGHQYVFKFDPRGFLHLSSAAGVIANRLFHAAGYHVPEDYIVAFDPARLQVDRAATVEGEDYRVRPMSAGDVQRVLELTDSLPDGRYLAVASRFVPGVPKGPFRFEGRRDDDPNDHYLHQHRRELRGLYVVASWVNHIDIRFANTLDSYVEPGYLRHYLIDFAASLGSGTIRPHYAREGIEYNFDLWPTLARLFTLGFYTHGWEGRDVDVIHPSIGWMQVEEFDPADWKPNWPNVAFRQVTERDGYWGAKLVGAFTDEQIRAAVEAGRLPDRFAADTLAAILRHRRDRIVRHWYGRVTPIEDPQVERGAGAIVIRFRDLGIESGAWADGATRYRYELEHAARGIRVAGARVAAEGRGSQRLPVPIGEPAAARPEAGGEAEPLATLRVTAERAGAAGRAATVYLAWEGSGNRYRVVGLEH